ncbi:hypothetical protein KM043_003596 [Ampulex compressa]|nr:hypothetical protein KM043_003596 [Ampulex compressa]
MQQPSYLRGKASLGEEAANAAARNDVAASEGGVASRGASVECLGISGHVIQAGSPPSASSLISTRPQPSSFPRISSGVSEGKPGAALEEGRPTEALPRLKVGHLISGKQLTFGNAPPPPASFLHRYFLRDRLKFKTAIPLPSCLDSLCPGHREF